MRMKMYSRRTGTAGRMRGETSREEKEEERGGLYERGGGTSTRAGERTSGRRCPGGGHSIVGIVLGSPCNTPPRPKSIVAPLPFPFLPRPLFLHCLPCPVWPPPRRLPAFGVQSFSPHRRRLLLFQSRLDQDSGGRLTAAFITQPPRSADPPASNPTHTALVHTMLLLLPGAVQASLLSSAQRRAGQMQPTFFRPAFLSCMLLVSGRLASLPPPSRGARTHVQVAAMPASTSIPLQCAIEHIRLCSMFWNAS
ncbi:hypothetical protein C8Q79DRAFT_101407 [Trametes meyenii]|nr:hypothetical protein C8Q79DRAFT_101407 [Trametes meyenii]